MPAPNMPIMPEAGSVSSFFATIFFAMWVMVQKRNIMVNALASADSALIVFATLVTSPANWVKKFPRIMKNGLPGGCPTSSLNAVVIYSPQSQKLAVGSIVIK